VARAGIASVDAGACVARAAEPVREAIARAPAWRLIAAGKAAVPMVRACLASLPRPPVRAMVVGPSLPENPLPGVEAFVGGHPAPVEGSIAAGRRALEIANEGGESDVLVVLLSGGASALVEVPADGVTLDDLRRTTALLLRSGADIFALNAVRKHLSSVKGGRLAAANRGTTVTLALSDVVGDDLSVIGSGPTVPDPSTYGDALDVLTRYGGVGAYPPAVAAAIEAGTRGERPETPKPGSPELLRASTTIVGALADALEGAQREARARGYHVLLREEPVIGEARLAAASLVGAIRDRAAAASGRTCLLSGGETTVTVTGSGRGGRNQEFALALARPLSTLPAAVAVASVGTDGIDGPTDAAGAVVDVTTGARAAEAGLKPPEDYLCDNDAYSFFRALGDLIVTGPTHTNVGDLQVAMLDRGDLT
jgi:hydroxypyruvate reductase